VNLIRISLLAISLLTMPLCYAEQEQMFPDIINAEVTVTKGGYSFSVTLSSPYDTPERYADAYRIMDKAGNIYGIRKLLHDHGYEQPFTRNLSRIEIPESVTSVIIEGRDKQYGWGGETYTLDLPSSN